MAYKPKILTSAEGGTGSSNTATSGKVLIGDGTNFISSTPTFPNSATGTGKILRADGTNWVATTATFPDTAGTSGNVLTSNGTNWASTAPAAAGLGYVFQLYTTSASTIADSTTYFFLNTTPVTSVTASGTAQTRYYIPKAGTITAVYGAFTCTAGTSESATIAIRLNNTSNTNVTTSLNMSGTDTAFNNNALSIAVALGDYIELLFITPAWVTNPSAVRFSISVYIS